MKKSGEPDPSTLFPPGEYDEMTRLSIQDFPPAIPHAERRLERIVAHYENNVPPHPANSSLVKLAVVTASAGGSLELARGIVESNVISIAIGGYFIVGSGLFEVANFIRSKRKPYNPKATTASDFLTSLRTSDAFQTNSTE